MGKTNSLETITLEPGVAELAARDFGADERLAVAARVQIAGHVQKLFEHLPGVVSDENPHDVHQARVATRRLRASLEATAPAFRQKQIAGLHDRLRKLTRSLGQVRDADVLLKRFRDDQEQAGDGADPVLQTMIDRLKGDRDDARTDLVAELERKRTAKLLDELQDFLICPLEDVAASDDGPPLLIRHRAGSAIWQQYEGVRRFDVGMPHLGSESLHQVRIAAKHLRYTLELFEPALAPEAKPVIELVKRIQEHLGNLHDVDVALGWIAEEGPEQSADEAPAGYRAERLAEREELLNGVAPLWKQFTNLDTRRKLAKILTAL